MRRRYWNDAGERFGRIAGREAAHNAQLRELVFDPLAKPKKAGLGDVPQGDALTEVGRLMTVCNLSLLRRPCAVFQQ